MAGTKEFGGRGNAAGCNGLASDAPSRLAFTDKPHTASPNPHTIALHSGTGIYSVPRQLGTSARPPVCRCHHLIQALTSPPASTHLAPLSQQTVSSTSLSETKWPSQKSVLTRVRSVSCPSGVLLTTLEEEEAEKEKRNKSDMKIRIEYLGNSARVQPRTVL